MVMVLLHNNRNPNYNNQLSLTLYIMEPEERNLPFGTNTAIIM